MITLLTFFSTISLFLFQAANATFQPANRIDPNAPDQQKSVDVFSWASGRGIVAIIVILAIAFTLGWFAFHGRKTKTDAVHRG